MALVKEVVNQTGAIREFEKPEVCEAIKVANANRWIVGLPPTEWDEREARLKKEYEENTKASGSDEEQPKEKVRIICCSVSPKADFYYKHFLNEGNPALKESASQFNDALLDEQAKKIVELTEENERLKDQVAVIYACKENNEKYNLKQIKRLGKEIARLNKIIHKKNLKIEELGKESSRHLRGKIKMFCENVDLEQMLKDKNAVLADVAEELRLSKIREKNLTGVSQKYMKENEELKKKLANKIVDKIDANVLKGAKSALAWKEKVVTYKDMALAYYEKKIAEKDEVIADLGKELAEAKKLNTAKILDINAKCMRAARESINDVFESYAAKYAKSTLDDLKEKAYESFNAKACNLGLVGSKDGNGIIDQMIGVDKAEEGGDNSAIIAQCCKNIAISKEEVKIIERCTKNGTELHYSEKDGFTYTNIFGDEIPIICLRGMYQVFTDEEIKNMKK